MDRGNHTLLNDTICEPDIGAGKGQSLVEFALLLLLLVLIVAGVYPWGHTALNGKYCNVAAVFPP